MRKVTHDGAVIIHAVWLSGPGTALALVWNKLFIGLKWTTGRRQESAEEMNDRVGGGKQKPYQIKTGIIMFHHVKEIR